jgi:acylphosphatase
VERRTIYFAGRVQGVGFRVTTRAIAARFPITGFVENLRDGRVRIVVEGDAEVLDAFAADVAGEMGRYIESQHVERGPASGEFAEFEIRR